MTTPELIEFIKNEFASGSTQESITNKLKTQGWSDLDVLEAFDILNKKAVDNINIAVISDKSKESPILINQTVLSTVHPDLLTSSRSKSLRAIILIFIIVLLLLGGLFAYASGLFISSSKLFSQMVESSKKNTSLSFNFDFVLDAANMKSFSSKIKPDSGISNISSFGMSGTLDLSNTKNLNLNNSYSFKSGGIEADIDSRVTNGSLYFRLTKAPSLGFISLKPIENKWIVFPYKDKTGNIENNPVLSLSPVSPDVINSLTEEQKNKFNDLIKNASFIKITKKHLPQIMNGSLVYHLDFDIDRDGISSFLKSVTSYLKILDKNNVASKFDTSNIDKMVSAVKEFKGEAWIGVFNKLPQKIIINTDIYNPNDINDGYVKISTVLNYTGWNKPVIVAIPSQSMTVEDLAKEALSTTSTSSVKQDDTSTNLELKNDSIVDPELKLTGDDLSKQNILTLMRSAAEIYHDSFSIKTYKGFCSSKGESGAYKLAVTLPKGSIYKCNDGLSEWASGVKLSDGKYWCNDSKNFNNYSSIIPKGTSCFK